MKVWGQLEGGQLEQVVGNPTPSPTGRIYIDITNPLSAVPYIYNGTAWRTLQLGQTAATVVQNSGKACTVDWSQGLYQQVVLTDNAVISFSNPVSGAEHNLLVTQATTLAGAAVLYNVSFNMIDQDTDYMPYQPAPLRAGENQLFKWFYKAGVKAAYANVPSVSRTLISVATLATGVAIAPDESIVTMGRTTSPFTSTYILGKGSPGAQDPTRSQTVPTALVAQAVGVAFSPDSKICYTCSGTTPFVQASANNLGTIGTIYTAPTALAGAAKCIAVSPNGLHVAVGHATTPFMSVLPWLGNAWGTKLFDPSTLPAAQVNGVAFSPCGDFISAASQSTPFIQTWNLAGQSIGTTSVGAYITAPLTLPAGGPAGALGKTIAWRPQGDYIAMAMTTTPFLYVVPFNRASGVYGTPLTVSSVPAAALTCLAWTPDGQYLICGMGSSPFFTIYDFSASTLGTLVTLDGSNPGQQVNDIAVSPAGDYMILALNAGAFAQTFTLPTKARNYLRMVNI